MTPAVASAAIPQVAACAFARDDIVQAGTAAEAASSDSSGRVSDMKNAKKASAHRAMAASVKNPVGYPKYSTT
jgi:hypothetical protein